MENDHARFGNLKNFNLFCNSFKAREKDRQVVIYQFVPPTFCFCICFTGINSRGMLDHAYDVIYDENRSGPIRTCKCRSTN